MRIRLRHPGGQTPLSFSATSTVDNLKTHITEIVGFSAFDLKYGYPPQILALESFPAALPLAQIPIQLDGTQIIVSRAASLAETQSQKQVLQATSNSKPKHSSEGGIEPSSQALFSFAGKTPHQSITPADAKIQSKRVEQDAPEFPLPTYQATLVLRIMPDDNSCLFRAFNSAFFGFMDNMVSRFRLQVFVWSYFKGTKHC